MYNSNNVAERIKLRAKQKGVSIRKLLSDINLAANTMGNMKKSMPKSDSLAKIADYLDCSVDYLLGRTKNPSCNLSNNDYNYVINSSDPITLKTIEGSGDVALQTLLHNYSGLNQAGRDRLVEYSSFVASAPEYQSESSAPEAAAEETVRVFIAARSTDNTPPQWVDMPAEEVERIFNLPESDFDL